MWDIIDWCEMNVEDAGFISLTLEKFPLYYGNIIISNIKVNIKHTGLRILVLLVSFLYKKLF